MSIDVGDAVSFKITSAKPIRKDDVYGGYMMKMNAVFQNIITPLSIDISIGDIVTPHPMVCEFCGILDESVSFQILGYSIETILAEKCEAILSRGITTTRPRDYYDVYVLTSTKDYSQSVFRQALKATAQHRGTWEQIQDIQTIIN